MNTVVDAREQLISAPNIGACDEPLTESNTYIPRISLTCKYYVAAALLITAIYLLFRNLAVGPILAGDELGYSLMSRHLPYRLDWIPNYIFYFVYGSTNYCGAQFYSCAKILNVVFFSVAAVFFFLMARLFAGEVVSFLLTVGFLMSPLNVYTTEFMPEIMYGAAAWMLLYWFVSRRSVWRISSVIVAAAGVAILTMIKPHGIFFGAAYLGALIFDMAAARQDSREMAKKGLLFVICFLAIRLCIGYGFAGRHGLSILGTTYSALAGRHGVEDYVRVLRLAASSALRHILAVGLIAGIPLCIMLVRSFRTSTTDETTSKLHTFAALFLIIMIGVTAAFTADVAGRAPGELIVRLHTRYYNFFDFVLVLVVLAELMRGREVKTGPKFVAGLSVALLAIASAVYLPGHFQHGLMDNPNIHGLFVSIRSFHLFALVNVLLIGIWILRPRMAMILFLAVQLPVGIVLSSKLLTRDLRVFTEYHNAYPKAGDLARVIWGKPLPEFFVAGTGIGEGFHTLFHLDKVGALIELGPNEPLHRSAVPPGISDGIIVGEHPIDFKYELTYVSGPIRIIRVTDP